MQRGSQRARTTPDYPRRQITTGVWPVGERIPIDPELSALLGVGRSTTPSSLLLTEFLEAYTHEELLSYRRALDIEAVQQAALHSTEADMEALVVMGDHETIPPLRRPQSAQNRIHDARGQDRTGR